MTVTLVDSVPMQVGRLTPVYEYTIALDAINTAEIVRTPTGTNRVWVVGWDIGESNATDATFVSGSDTKRFTYELSANQAHDGEVKRSSYYFVTKPGEALKIQASVIPSAAVGSNLVLKVCEGDKL